MKDTNTDWQKAANEMSMVIKEYDNDFCHEMCATIYKELERRAKNGR